MYSERLKDVFVRPFNHSDYYDVFHIYNIRHPRRDQLKEYLEKNGIKTDIHYPVPPHRQKAYAEMFQGQSFPISDLIHQTTVSLPISFFHSEDEIERVIDVLNRF